MDIDAALAAAQADPRFQHKCQEDGCGQTHEATPSHHCTFSGRQVFEVVCTSTPEWFSSFWTDDVVVEVTA